MGRFFFKDEANFILCYHSFSPKENKFAISAQEFKKQIVELSKIYQFVSLDEVIKPSTKKSVAITIDDGYADVFLILPTIRKYNIPVTLFLIADSAKVNRAEIEHSGKLLSVTQLKILQKEGFSFGCHSMTHANFAKLSKEDIYKEIVDAKKMLEHKIKLPVPYFAYPKGVYSNEIIKLIKKAGFKAAFTVLPGSVGENLLLIPRTIIDKSYTAQDITALFNPIFVNLKSFASSNRLWRFVNI